MRLYSLTHTKAVLFMLMNIFFNVIAHAESRPNIIVILTDDMGYSDIGAFGGEIQTPNLNQLAMNGLKLTEFYNVGRCWPTRATLISGRYAEGLYPEQTSIATVLKNAGYQTGMVGKWHLALNAKGPNAPLQRGFDSFYGTMKGTGSFYDPATLMRNTEYIKPDSKDFYYTDKIGEEASLQIKEFAKSKKPFFQYIAHPAPHWPIHAPEKTVQKYINTYKDGWDKIREDRYARMIKMGLIDKNTAPLPAKEPGVPAWKDVDNKKWRIRNMAVYAAMVDHVDQAVGNVINTLKETNQFDNTLIIFINDNGASPEITSLKHKPATKQELGPHVGGPNSYASVGPNWANIQNTPLRRYKNNTHQGGVKTSAIMHWPKGIKQPGSISRQRGHVVDLLATSIELARTTYPKTQHGVKILLTDGISLTPILFGKQVNPNHDYFFQRGGKVRSQALISGDYKVVKENKGAWALYNLKDDVTETNNITEKHPQLVKEMTSRFYKKKWMHPSNRNK